MEKSIESNAPKGGIDNVSDSSSRALSESVSGFDNFKDVRSAMTSGRDTLKAFDGNNAPTIENASFRFDPNLGKDGADKGNSKGSGVGEFQGDSATAEEPFDGIIVPENQELYKTPEYKSEFYQPRTTFDEGAEKGAAKGDKATGDQAAGPFGDRGASSELKADGSVGRVQVDDGAVKYDFKATEDGGMSRELNVNGGREVVQFDKSGKPVSKHVYFAGSDVGITQNVNPKDTLGLSKDANGDTVLQSKDSGRNTDMSVTVGKDGSVKSRSETSKDSQRETIYNPDGSVQTDALTKLDKNGNKVEKITESADATRVESFDESGKVNKTQVYGDGYKITVDENKDGSKMGVRENDDGTKSFSGIQADGTLVEGSFDGEANRIKTTKPDGSYTESSETKDTSSYTIGDAQGNWMSVSKNRRNDTTTYSRGNGADIYESGLQQGI